jgi:nicotinamide phosphoribosyltransferase
MLNQFAKPGAVVACVSDSFNIYYACSELWGKKLRQQIIDSGAILVIRPDSGEPKEVVIECMKILAEKFGTTTNTKGYQVLRNVKLIQGDGVNENSIEEILDVVLKNGFSASNIGFGCGGHLLQQNIHRDLQRFAMKCSSVTVDGKEVSVYKEPITDKIKVSKKGRLDLLCDEKGQYQTIQLSPGQISHPQSVLETVFENGEIKKEYTLDEVRARANQGTILLTGE